MMFFQMLYKSVLGMMLGICAGAILVGLVAAMVGPQWVISGMLLGAMAGSFLGSAAGFLKSIEGRERAVQPQPAVAVRSARARRSIPVSGD